MSETDTREYQLTDGVSRVVRSGLQLAAGETIDLHPTAAAEHDDVLEPVGDLVEDEEDDGEDQEEDDE